MEKGKGKWIRIIIHYNVHIQVAASLNETKKGGESKILRLLKRGI